MSSDPLIKCTVCSAERNCMAHTRAEHPPTAAKRYLKKICWHVMKPCRFEYRAGGL